MGFIYVLVPCSPNDDMQEFTYEDDVEALESDTFRGHIEKYFRGLGQSVDKTILLEQLSQRSGVNLDEKTRSGEMSGEALEGLLSATSVEIFPLMMPTKDTGFEALSVYCDDKGIAKGLEDNTRMSALAQAASYAGQTFKGDCFIGKVYDDTEDEWRRIDFTLADCSSDASWVTAVRRQRANRSSGDMKSLADKIGMNNPAQISGSAQQGEAASGDHENYRWKQVGDEVEITLKSEGLAAGDKTQVKVNFTRKHLKVEVRGEILIDHDLYAATHPDEALWTLTDGELQVMLSKVDEDEWPSLLAE